MPMHAGDFLGPYQILAPLGAGGMGEVYRARDPRLGREVAIKILHEESAADVSRRARFEFEARAVAALNHPNILSVYDFASDNGRYYIVSELVMGESLRARVDRSPIGIRELYRIAVQLTDGLSAAHAAGIAHRDLKPENVMLTTDGRIKILDFGLARQTALATSAESETRTQGNTLPGTVLGTVAYMSPEQVRGIPADHRSDQFSFGTLLYELAAGSRPFTRETFAQTMTAILTEEPPPLDSKVPAPLRWTIARCHEKDPAARYDSTRDLYHDLCTQQEHLSEVVTTTEASTPVRVTRKERRRWLFTAPIAVGLLVGVFAGWFSKPAGGGPGQLRFTPKEVALAQAGQPRWSPDGKAFAFSAKVAGVSQIFLRYLDSPAPTQLTHGPVAAHLAGFTPDGKRVIVFSVGNGRQAKTKFSFVPLIGGAPEPMAPEARPVRYVDIAPDGKGFAALLYDGGKYFIETAPSPGSPGKRYPPGPFEATVLYNNPNLGISPDHRRLLFVADTIGARNFWDLSLPAGRKAPRRVLRGLATFGETPVFSWLPDSRHIVLALQATLNDEHNHLWIADVESGALRQLTGGITSESDPAVSPDGTRVLFVQDRPEYSLVSVALDTAAAERVMTSELLVGMPAWAASQEKFVYQSDRNGPPEIWLHADGWDRPVVTPAQFPAATTGEFMNPALSPGADRVVYGRPAPDGVDLWISSVSGGAPVRLTNEANVTEFGGCWLPDANRLAYLRFVDGKWDLAVVRASGDAAPEVIRHDIGNRLPACSPDGRWIAFLESGLHLISPDGKTVRDLGSFGAFQFTFSKDSRLLYGIRLKDGRPQLFSLDIKTKNQKVIGEFDKDLRPSTYVNPGVQLSLSPDGKSILFSSVRHNTSIWMMEGFDPPRWTERLREMLSW